MRRQRETARNEGSCDRCAAVVPMTPLNSYALSAKPCINFVRRNVSYDTKRRSRPPCLCGHFSGPLDQAAPLGAELDTTSLGGESCGLHCSQSQVYHCLFRPPWPRLPLTFISSEAVIPLNGGAPRLPPMMQYRSTWMSAIFDPAPLRLLDVGKTTPPMPHMPECAPNSLVPRHSDYDSLDVRDRRDPFWRGH